jgi:hypothetical protein
MDIQILINGIDDKGKEICQNITDIEEAIEFLSNLLN